jgi:hypothetical protein
VPVTAIADEVDEEILPELRAVRDAETDGRDARLEIVGVDVNDRDLEALREVARVARRAGLVRVGRKADLIVHDDVQRSADAVTGEP